MIIGLLLIFFSTFQQPVSDTLIVLNGYQSGVGIGYEKDEEFFKITRLIADGPAEKSGQISLNDRIIAVGEGESSELNSVKGLSLEEFGGLLLGPVGLPVRIALLTEGQSLSESPKVVTLFRDLIMRGLNLTIGNSWYFKAGDNLQWADPKFNHSDWLKLRPFGLSEPLPDSIWSKGYGWFRSYFKADSNFYSESWYLQFYTWGAAEVYIDGKLIKKYGVFSTNPDLEKGNNPQRKAFSPFWIAPKDTHLVAVRFSYHSAKRNKELMGDKSGDFGFGLGFLSQKYQDSRVGLIERSYLMFYLLFGVYSIIIILHGYLYFLFRQQKENLLVALLVFLLLCNSVIQFYFPVSDFDKLIMFLFVEPIELIRFAILLFIPYVLVTFFNLKRFDKLRFLPLLAIPLFVLITLFEISQILVLYVIVSIVFVLCLILLNQAKKNKAKGIGFIAFGFVGMILHILIPLSIRYFNSSLLAGIANSVYFDISFLTIIPVSMTLLIAYRMANLYTGLEGIVEERTDALNLTINNLKSTQAQLIHAEKMASLGELTAGIAHEIQNPLNFVNNFSEVNNELIEEQLEEIEKGDLEEIKELALIMKENGGKINHHGKRAGDIVKSMLQHSRVGSGEKELTNINSLADEYLRLSYHGLRAKDKSFNAEIKTVFDPELPKVNVIPQDIGRVLLNLINNAFQACASVEKPLVQISTRKTETGIEITVSDNGPGIPDSIKDKIFQPFFTTKPTGQGTGLGLSLSYDIVKAHGGTLEVATTLSKGTVFKIHLSVTNS
jgi:two-component system NtrC family sensor kinase